MIRPRWQKAISDVIGNVVRSLLVVASILVGLFAIGIISTIFLVLQQDMQDGYAAASPANILINASPFDDPLVKRIRHLGGVSSAEGAFKTSLRVKTGAEEWTVTAFEALRDQGGREINRVVLKQGTWPPKKGEVVLDVNKFSDLNTALNDVIQVELPSGDLHALKVVGIVQDQTIGAFGYGGGFFLAPPQGYIDSETLAFLGYPDVYNTVYLTVKDGDNLDQINQVERQVRDEIEKNGYTVYNTGQRISSDHPNYTYVDAISGVLFLLGFLIVFLSGFLITNTLSALLGQQIAQIGIMKTVGARRYQIMSIYMMVIFFFGLAAFLISVPLSQWASYQLLEFLATKINIALQGQQLLPLPVLLQGVIALFVPQIAGFLPILRGARIPVQAAISGTLVDETGRPGKAGTRKRIRVKKVSRPLLISLRNVFRSKSRLVLTLITLSLGGAVFIATFNVRSSLQVYIDQVIQYFRADVNITLDRYYRVDRIEAIVNDVPGVTYIEPWITARGEILRPDGSVGDSFSMIAPPAGSPLVEPILISGRWIIPGDQQAIALSETFRSNYPGIHVGDTIKVKIDGDETEWQVVGFFQLAGRSGGLVGYAAYDALSGALHRPNRSDTFRVTGSHKNMTTDEQKRLGEAIEKRLQQEGLNVRELSAGTSLHSSTAKGLDTLTTFLLIMAGLTALVGSIGLTGTMSLNVMERTREIGVMRAIGASDGSLFLLVITEGGMIGIISWIIGSILSFPISRAMSDTINKAIFDAPSTFTWTIDGFLIWLVIVTLLSVVASILPARNATRLTIREVLSYE